MDALTRTASFPSIEPTSPVGTNSVSPSPAVWLAGSSAAMTQLRGQIGRVAPYFRTAMLTGEPGSGEEAAAHTLHQLSPRCQHPFLELTLSRAQAHANTRSFFESVVHSGMIYLPNPGRLPQIIQNDLLRLLRDRGSQAPRIVAFAERGLRQLVTTGGLSSDLADALGALRITLPSVRERREDIPQLLNQILLELAERTETSRPELAPDLIAAALKQPWQGNFTRLYSVAEGLMQFADKQLLHVEDIEAVLGTLPRVRSDAHPEARMLSLDDVIQEHIRSVLFACHGNKLRTAEILGISRSTLYRMLETHGPAPLTASSARRRMTTSHPLLA
jgi:DNA-binding NtrC family response regulator